MSDGLGWGQSCCAFVMRPLMGLARGNTSKLILKTKMNKQNTLLLAGPSGFPGDSVVKNPPTNGLGRSSKEGHGNPLQYSCLENPMDRGAWWATVQGITRAGHNRSNSAKTTGPLRPQPCRDSGRKRRQVGSTERGAGREGGPPPCASVFCFQLPVVKTPHFHVPYVARGGLEMLISFH